LKLPWSSWSCGFGSCRKKSQWAGTERQAEGPLSPLSPSRPVLFRHDIASIQSERCILLSTPQNAGRLFRDVHRHVLVEQPAYDSIIVTYPPTSREAMLSQSSSFRSVSPQSTLFNFPLSVLSVSQLCSGGSSRSVQILQPSRFYPIRKHRLHKLPVLRCNISITIRL
jgi:hypothetical protein